MGISQKMEKAVDKKEINIFFPGADKIRRKKYFAEESAPFSEVGPERTPFRLEAQNVRRPIFAFKSAV